MRNLKTYDEFLNESVKSGKNAKGIPNKLYHGTPFDFKTFSGDFLGVNTKHVVDDVGFHFSDLRSYAESYSKNHDRKSAEAYKYMIGEYPKDYKPFEPYMFTVKLSINNPHYVKISKDIHAETMAYAKANGYDAIIAINKGAERTMGREYVVFDVDQIKIL